MLHRRLVAVCAMLCLLVASTAPAHSQAHTYKKLFDFSSSDRPISSLFALPDGNLYGPSFTGGVNGYGYLYKVHLNGTGFQHLHDFQGVDGKAPWFLTPGPNGWLYGSAEIGGQYGNGTLFRIKPDGTSFQDLHDFKGKDGSNPSTILFGQDGRIYGVAYGGASARGVIFRINWDGNGFQIVLDFATTSSLSSPTLLTLGADGALYGVAQSQATHYDAIFRLGADGSGLTDIHDCSKAQGDSIRGLLQGKDGRLYGYTWYDGPGQIGNVFALHTDGTGFQDLHDFDVHHSYNTALLQGPDGRLNGACMGYGWQGSVAYGVSAMVWSLAPDGTDFRPLHSFDGAYESPYSLAFGKDGALYGYTYGEDRFAFPAYSDTLFRVSPDGVQFDYLHWFSNSGINRLLAFGVDGALYGVDLKRNSTATSISTLFTHTMQPDPSPTLALIQGASLPGTTMQITASLKANVGLPDMPVDFIIKQYFDLGWMNTNSSGIATFSLLIPSWFIPGAIPLHLYFPGITTADDITYQPARHDGFLTILADAAITALPTMGTIGKKTTFSASLNSDGMPLAAETLTFAIGSVALGTATTDDLGNATVSCVIPATVSVGNQTLTVTFPGDGVYAPATGTAALTINKAPVTLTALAVTATRGQKANLIGTLTRATDHTPLATATLRFKIDGTAVGTAKTNRSGQAKLVYLIPQGMAVGAHTITISFDGDAQDSAAIASSTLKVN